MYRPGVGLVLATLAQRLIYGAGDFIFVVLFDILGSRESRSCENQQDLSLSGDIQPEMQQSDG